MELLVQAPCVDSTEVNTIKRDRIICGQGCGPVTNAEGGMEPVKCAGFSHRAPHIH